MLIRTVFEAVLMDPRDTLHISGKFHHSTVFTATGFHVPVSAQFLKHRPFNSTFFGSQRLALSRLIR
ncbi:hypothetical protein L422_00702 [Enterobacter hormaechei]|nr:hypothetical protein L422_00702 [Enterobacter hormaechei]